MLEFLIEHMNDRQSLITAFAAVAAIATVLSLAMPLLATNSLGKRMKAVAFEREKIRQRERERMARGEKVSLRQSPKQYVKTIVERFNLTKWLAQEEVRGKLVQAGYRGQAPYITFLFFRMLTPIILFPVTAFYLFVVLEWDQPTMVKVGICVFAAYLGLQLPLLFLKNKIAKRQLSIKRAFPDALDLLLICVESGMSIEAAFRRVSMEIGSQSIALAEELTLTTAELSYLQDRRQAYDNLGKRTDLEGVKAVCIALQQAERYGTSTRPNAARALAGKPRHAHDGSREKGRRPAAQIDRADDPVLPSRALRRDSRTGGDPCHGHAGRAGETAGGASHNTAGAVAYLSTVKF